MTVEKANGNINYHHVISRKNRLYCVVNNSEVYKGYVKVVDKKYLPNCASADTQSAGHEIH